MWFFFCKIIVIHFILCSFTPCHFFPMVLIFIKSKCSQVSFQFPVLYMTCSFPVFVSNFIMCSFRHWPFYFELISSTSYIYYALEIDINFLVDFMRKLWESPLKCSRIFPFFRMDLCYCTLELMDIIFSLVIFSW